MFLKPFKSSTTNKSTEVSFENIKLTTFSCSTDSIGVWFISMIKSPFLKPAN